MKMKILGLAVALALPVAGGAIAAEKIDIVGTGDGMNVLRSLGTAFSETDPAVSISVPESIGSGGGIKAVGKDKFKLGRVARPIKDKEKHYGLEYKPFAKVPVAFYVNQSVSVKDLSAEQVVGIFSGEITNWKQVGGKDAPIRVVRREDGDSSLGVLTKTFPGFENLVMTTHAKTAVSTQESFESVEGKAGTIGFGPYSEAIAANVKILSIDGVAPTDPAYPSATTLALIYKPDVNTGDVAKFLSFTQSAAGRTIIERANAVPY